MFRGEADIRELPPDVTHRAKRLKAVGLGFARVAEDEVEVDTDAGERSLAGSLVHLVDALMTLVHHFEHRL